jgi:GH18 family chitinase
MLRHVYCSFAKQAAELLSVLHLDGLDLDWEFPDWPPPGQGGRERRAFSSLLGILHRHFTAHGKRRLLLSVAVAAPKTIIDVSYDVPLMAKYV